MIEKNENLLNQNLTTLTCILRPRNRLIVLITYNQKQNTVSLAHQKENVKVHFDYKTSLSLNICPVKISQKSKKNIWLKKIWFEATWQALGILRVKLICES